MKPHKTLPAAFLGIAVLLTFGCMTQRAALVGRQYSMQVDYSRSVEDSLRAGQYAWTHYQLTSSNFPSATAGSQALSVVLVRFSVEANLDFVLGAQTGAGLRPASLKELLAFGEAYPEVQKDLPLLALGSSADLSVNIFWHETGMGFTARPRIELKQKVKRLYPFLAGGILGRVAGLEWLGDPDGYRIYYALFVKPQ
jgi:hypothetical protein